MHRLLLCILVPMLLVQAGIYAVWLYTRVEKETQANTEVAYVMNELLQAYFQDVQRQQLAIGTAIAELGPNRHAAITHVLEVNRRQYASIDSMHWIDARGKVVASTNPRSVGMDLRDRDHIQRILHGQAQYVSPLLQSRLNGRPTFYIVRGIRDQHGKLQGIVSAAINPQGLGEKTFTVHRPAGGGFTIIDQAGTVVYDSGQAAPTWKEREWARRYPEWQRTVDGSVVAGTFHWRLDGNKRITALVPLESDEHEMASGWVVSASRPISVVLHPIVLTLLGGFGILMLAALFSLGMALAMARRITAPIHQLHTQARAFGGGDPHIYVPESGPLETQGLAHAFNEMAETIEAQREELTAQNEELQSQQEELMAQNEELQTQQEELTVQSEKLFTKNEELLHLTRDLERERAFISAAFDVLPIPLTLIAPDGSTLQRNPASRAFLAHQPFLDMPEATVLDAHTHTPVPFEQWPHNRALRGEVVTFFEQLFVAPGQREVPSLVHAAPVRIGDEVIAAVVALQDITPLKVADRAKDEFLAVLSHELQTPLTSILGWSEMALNNTDVEFLRQSIEVVHRNAHRQKRLVSDLLDISRIIHGKLAIHPEPTELWTLVAQQAESVQHAAGAQGITLALDPPDETLLARVDPARIGQAVANLLNNALKFTGAGGTVTLGARRTGASATINVTDTGSGIPPEYLNEVFNPFRQLRRDEATGGLGLGLALVKGIVELQAGRVSAASPGLGHGSTFTIELPLIE
ncbi:MAG: ATP-binding protein [Armatimonadota bacterium]